jgi:hypothetical protein
MSHRIVSREEWLRVRTALLEQEKALTRHAVVARAPIEEIEIVYASAWAGNSFGSRHSAATSTTTSTCRSCNPLRSHFGPQYVGRTAVMWAEKLLNFRYWHFCDMARDVDEGRFKPGSGHLRSGAAEARL